MVMQKKVDWRLIMELIMLACTVVSAFFAIRAERRISDQLKPIISRTPVEFIMFDDLKAGQTNSIVSNLSPEDAYNVTFDMKYEGNDWLEEWQKTRGIQPYTIPRIDSGKHYLVKQRAALPTAIEEICDHRKGMNMLLRTRWMSEKGELFEDIRGFKLVCTSQGDSRSFTFIPNEEGEV